MRRRLAIAIAVGALALPLTAHPDELRDGLMRGYNLLMDGDVQAALEQYKELDAAYPGRPLIQYNLGCAEFRNGETQLAGQNVEEAVLSFDSARTAFEGAQTSDDEQLRRNAGFNAATTAMPLADESARAYFAALGSGTADPQTLGTAYEVALKGFGQSVDAYGTFLQRYPDDKNAEQNLEYARYRLKELLQNPPPEPPEQEQQKGEDGKDEQQKEEGEQQQENQEGDQEQEDQDQKEQDQDQEQEPQEQPGDEEKEQQQQPQPEQGDQQQQPQEGEEQEAQPNELNDENRQTIEAILDSIEEQDRREQEVLRKGTGGQIRGDWW